MKPFVASRSAAAKFTLTLVVVLCGLFYACKKTDRLPNHEPPPNPPGTKIGQLKDMNVERLPSPFYHFDYTDQGVATDISFASGLYIYKLSYKNGRLDKMENRTNNNTLVYEYHNGRVASIRTVRPDNSVVWHYTFEYNNDDLVSEIRWHLISQTGTDSLVKKVLFFYYNDGNLEHFEKYASLTTPELVWIQSTQFSDYDNGKNVDDFSQYKDFFDHVLYLPGVRFQRNNAKKTVITTELTDYEVADTWTYQDGLPAHKQSRITETRGSNAGRVTIGNTSFSYY